MSLEINHEMHCFASENQTYKGKVIFGAHAIVVQRMHSCACVFLNQKPNKQTSDE